ncbi:DUF4825 domain-containing protein [Bacillus luteolus]|uniref:DUF4825 domain-containing protein n=1 Tax=Litchfieldia luteola TaxID=682179 RepID=A0ABR9QMY7_9BACI|nr:DUF4825 domain-containing protein [Cytobacillus luteolus]MBE4909866.1 DUF4825 domain-containing protein [Cytobacillus luteolus]MBP1942584.1 hypothetical protein [Cytobacillus luteolus]
MRNLIMFSFFSLLMLLLLNGCNSIEVIDGENLFEFKDSYVGDAGAVGNITRQLPKPSGEQISGMELQTSEEPYGIILNYIAVEHSEDIETNYSELAIYNATIILSLVKNADWVNFNFINQEFEVRREDLQKFYGKDIREFNTEEELRMFMQKKLEDENKVLQFFK